MCDRVLFPSHGRSVDPIALTAPSYCRDYQSDHLLHEPPRRYSQPEYCSASAVYRATSLRVQSTQRCPPISSEHESEDAAWTQHCVQPEQQVPPLDVPVAEPEPAATSTSSEVWKEALGRTGLPTVAVAGNKVRWSTRSVTRSMPSVADSSRRRHPRRTRGSH